METKHEALYKYLESKGDTWTPQVEVARDLFAEFGNGECCLAPEEYHDTHERHILSKVIAEINESYDFEKIIISSGKGIKIANEEEHQRYLVGQYRSVLRRLKRVYIMEKKGNLHNQIGIDGNAIAAFIKNFE